MKTNVNYDNIMKEVNFKYAVPIIAAKRAEILKDSEEMQNSTIKTQDGNYVTIALREIELGIIKVKDIDKLNSLRTEMK